MATSEIDRPARRTVLGRMVLASIVILLLAQALNGILTWSAQRNAAALALETTIRIVGHDRVFHIENALRLGKPITQMHGLGETLDSLARELPFVDVVGVALPAGQLVEVRGGADAPELAAAAVRAAQPGAADRAAGVGRVLEGMRTLVLPVRGRGGELAGHLLFVMPDAAVDQAIAGSRESNLRVLIVSSALGTMLLLAAALVLFRCSEATFGRGLYIAPFAALLLAQGAYSWHNVETFRESYLSGLRANVQRATDRLGEEFDRLFSLGVRIQRLSGLDAPFQRILDDIPELEAVSLRLADGTTLFHHARTDGAASGSGRNAPLAVRTVLHGARDGDGPRPQIGALVADLSSEAVAQGVRQRVLDAGTVALTSAIFVVELLILFAALMHAYGKAPLARDAAAAARERPLLARTAAFGLLFAWALPLSFVPLHMEQLYVPIDGVPADFMLALPVSAEMLFALLATLFAGRLADRRGWHHPFLAGVLICALGALGSALAVDAAGFVAARAVVGLGYGLAWMGIQAHVFAASSARGQTHAIASLVAGIFAGHLCGSATGGMLAEQFGHASVFLMAALAGLLPMLFALLFMREHFHAPSAPSAQVGEGAGAVSPVGVRTLLVNRDFSALLALCVVPFSIVQVGLLYFALPVHLGSQGASPSDIGRILMVYGLSVIYLGPVLGRWIGRFERRKPFIVIAGLLGGGGLAWIYLDASIGALVLSVFLLGVVSSFGGPAQSSFALHLPVVQQVGKSRAMSIQRTADKLGQMLGPLLVGALFALFGSQAGLALSGVLYMLCTLLFLLLARESGLTSASRGAPE